MLEPVPGQGGSSFAKKSYSTAELAVGLEREIGRSDLEFPELYPPDDSHELEE